MKAYLQLLIICVVLLVAIPLVISIVARRQWLKAKRFYSSYILPLDETRIARIISSLLQLIHLRWAWTFLGQEIQHFRSQRDRLVCRLDGGQLATIATLIAVVSSACYVFFGLIITRVDPAIWALSSSKDQTKLSHWIAIIMVSIGIAVLPLISIVLYSVLPKEWCWLRGWLALAAIYFLAILSLTLVPLAYGVLEIIEINWRSTEGIPEQGATSLEPS